jgi:alpha-ketoglutarate-dependent taurine dioxygenase
MNEFIISQALRQEIKALSELVTKDIYLVSDKYSPALSLIIKRHSNEIQKLKNQLKSGGLLLISNFYQSKSQPKTPQLPDQEINKNIYDTEINLIFIATVLGNAFTYEQENKNYIHQIFPAISHKNTKSSLGSDNDLDFHTEVAYSKDKPDYLALTCVRSANNIPTALVDMKLVMKDLMSETVEYLKNNYFFVRQPSSFKGEVNFRQIKLIEETLEPEIYNFSFNFAANIMISSDHKAASILEEVKQKIIANQKRILIKEGQILVIDNHCYLHGRDKIDANFDGYDRWLQRVYIRKNN